ncbi:hypothetical protein EV127DRAFT_499877 [Xylaria flabelliformis]|nr:hypothetical protein EV127DRAFT_499877 [Xylaria flabelliformis]
MTNDDDWFPEGLEERECTNWPGIVSYKAGGCSKDNATLRERPKIKQFFQEVDDLKFLADDKTLNWLATIRRRLFNEAIPLFEDADGLEQYRIRPSLHRLKMRKATFDHCQDVIGLSYLNSTNNKRKDIHIGGPVGARLVVYIGQLCVYLRGGRRRSTWTGYDVFVDYALGLWMVFNNHVNHDRPLSGTKHHFPCKLTKPSNMESTYFDFAKFCESLHEIETTTLEKAIELVARHTRTFPQRKVEFEHISTTYMNRTHIQQKLRDMVVTDTADSLKFWELDSRFTRSMVKENISAEILVLAVANEHCGRSLTHYLLRQYGPLRELIEKSPAIVTAAAGNMKYGMRILQMLHGAYLGGDNRNRKLPVSKLAVMKAAIDKIQGLDMLKFFFAIRQRVFIGHMSAIFKGECAPDEEEERRLLPEAQKCLDENLYRIHPFLWYRADLPQE